MAKFNSAIVGVGFTEYSLNSRRSVSSLAVESCQKAMDEAGLRPQDVDGILEFNLNDSVSTAAVATSLGLPIMNYGLDWLGGGYAPCALLAMASMAVDAGMAKAVLIYRAMNGRSGFRLGGGSGGAGWETFAPKKAGQYRIPYGWLSYGQNMAMFARRHMERYGTKPEHLAAIAINQRTNALLNDRAMHRKPLTLDDYMSSRMIVDPLRLYDMCLESDGACAVLVTSSDRAKDCRKKPVYIKSAAFFEKAGVDDPIMVDSFLWPDLTENYTAHLSQKLYKEAGIGPKDIDVAEIYDCFTFTVLMGLEGLGFCPKGEGGPFAASGAIALGGEIPVNTHGGMLSEAYLHGMNVLAEAVMQLRGEGGARQVPNAEIAIATSGGGSMGSGAVLST